MVWIEFQRSLADTEPPSGLTPALEALWLDGKGNWDAAHNRLQGQNAADSAWVHAYLHRKEGDLSNAGYWYRRAGQPTTTGPLVEEWETMVQALLSSA